MYLFFTAAVIRLYSSYTAVVAAGHSLAPAQLEYFGGTIRYKNFYKKSPNDFILKTAIEQLNEIRLSEQEAQELSPSGSV